MPYLTSIENKVTSMKKHQSMGTSIGKAAKRYAQAYDTRL